jgi:two-component system, OmpR family, sensor histidine kinase KdpD
MLDNALKYSAAPTPIGIAAHIVGGQLEIRVEDQGDGIQEQDLNCVFDKFNRARRTGETGGIGLGLSICKGLVEAHYGTIRAERRDPSGTVVAFRLPLLQERER